MRSLQRLYGNRFVARQVSRQLMRAPPKDAHPSWADQTTFANRALGKEIDALEQLDDKELERRRQELLTKASIWDDSKHQQYEQTLEAIEWLAAQRSFKPLVAEGDYRESSNKSTSRRRTVRLLIEEGIRNTGSFEDSIKGLTNAPKEFENDFYFFRKEAKEFGAEFTRQARDIGVKMLEQSELEVYTVVESYGLRRQTAFYSAKELITDSDRLGKVVQQILDAPAVWFKEQEVETKSGTRYDPWVTHRRDLADAADALRAQQKIVLKIRDEAQSGAGRDSSGAGQGSRAPAPIDERLTVERQKLAVMWAQAERSQPLLAAVRGGSSELEDARLGDLAAGAARPQMAEMLTQVLPKLAAILDVKGRIQGGSLKALSLPPVVALTKATMFVPDGSLRAGVVNDLVESAQDSSVLKYIGLGLLALIALAAALPTAGESLGVGIGMISFALSAGSAIEDWEDYKKQKLLNNTALDRAKALAVEEPSLWGFALDLVFLGLDGAPLVKAFGKAVQVRRLVAAGGEAKNAAKVKQLVNELNDIGKAAKNDAKLGERALDDARAAERDAAASGRRKQPEEVDPASKKPAGEHDQPRPKTGHEQGGPRKPPHSDYNTGGELRTAVHAHINNALEHAGANEEWTELWERVDRAKLLKEYPKDAELLKQIDKVHALMRDPKVYEDAMVELWETAARDGITEQEALMRWAGGEPVPHVHGQDADVFRKALRDPKPLIDEFFRDTAHGAETHMFQEYALARALGSKDAARNFRHLIAEAEGPVRNRQQFFSQVWDAVFDVYDGSQVNSPEGIGPILKAHLNLE